MKLPFPEPSRLIEKLRLSLKKTVDFSGADDLATAQRQINQPAHQRQEILRPPARPIHYFAFQSFDGMPPVFPLRIFFEKPAIDPNGSFQTTLSLINSRNTGGAAMAH